jgi:hypothetical protein
LPISVKNHKSRPPNKRKPNKRKPKNRKTDKLWFKSSLVSEDLVVAEESLELGSGCFRSV